MNDQVTEPEVIPPTAEHDDGNVALVQSSMPDQSFLNALIADAVRNGNVDVVDRLLAARNREIDREREIVFKQAYVRMRNEIPVIVKHGKVDGKTRAGSQIKYDFARLAEDIDPVIQPIMKRHRFDFTFSVVGQTDDYVEVEGELIYQDNGWSVRSRKREPIDKASHMGLQQKGGAAQTFAMRYLTVAMLALRIAGEDTDGHRRDAVVDGGRDTYGTAADIRNERKKQQANSPSFRPWVVAATDKLGPLNAETDGWKWIKTLQELCVECTGLADLNEFDEYVETALAEAEAPPEPRVSARAAIAAARKRLSAHEKVAERFAAILYDAQGKEVASHTDPLAWIKAFNQQLDDTFPLDRDGLRNYNTATVCELRKTASYAALLPDAKEPTPDAPTAPSSGDAPVAPLTYEPVEPAKIGDKEQWAEWVNRLRDELATATDLLAFVEAQNAETKNGPPPIRRAPTAFLVRACTLLGSTLAAAEIPLPFWLAEAWAGCVEADLKALPKSRSGRQRMLEKKEDPATVAIMLRLKVDHPETFASVRKAFVDAHQTLPGGEVRQ